jgi:hypothetical protein
MVSVDEYAGCNRSVVRFRWPSVFETYVYDFTTHALLGATLATRSLYECGDGGTGTLQAGATMIDQGCVQTRHVDQCPDRGDAAPDN